MSVKSLHEKARKVLSLYLPLVAYLIFVLFPFYWILVSSLKPEADIITFPVNYLPTRITLENYSRLFARFYFAKYLVNSVIVSLSTMCLSLVISTGAGYAFARFRFRGRTPLRLSFLAIYLFPPILLLLPLFIVMRSLGLLDTYWSLIIAYATWSIPFGTWMLIGFFMSLPSELEDAAMVDGCTRLGAFVRVLLPLAAPGLTAAGIFIFILSWNEFLMASMFTSSTGARTLPVAIQLFARSEVVRYWGAIHASAVVAVLPAAILFTFIEKYLVQGMTAGALKG